MKTVIHVNQHNIKANRKHGSNLPVITAKNYKHSVYGKVVEIIKDGFVVAKVVYAPDKPLSCGAHCWIETQEKVNVL